MNNKPWFSASTEAVLWMRDEARQWVDDKPEVAAHLFEAAMMFEKAELDAKRYRSPNARLIAASPDLLAALQAIPMQCDHKEPHLLACWVCKARAAIAKATQS